MFVLLLFCLFVAGKVQSSPFRDRLELVVEMLNHAVDSYLSFNYQFQDPLLPDDRGVINIYSPFKLREGGYFEDKAFINLQLPAGVTIVPYYRKYDQRGLDFENCIVEITFSFTESISKPRNVSVPYCQHIRHLSGAGVQNGTSYLPLLSQALQVGLKNNFKSSEREDGLKAAQHVFEQVIRQKIKNPTLDELDTII